MRMLLIREDEGVFSVTTITELRESLLGYADHVAIEGFWDEWSGDINYENLIYRLNDYFGVKSK